MSVDILRFWLIRWMYVIAFGHFATGILLAWFANLSLFDGYHQSILSEFGVSSANVKTLQVWWVSLFGATVQTLAIFMGVLTYVANKQRNAFVWGWMIMGLVLWAPQDILISLQVNVWLHVWVDLIALFMMVPPLVILWCIDRNHKTHRQE